uniref:Uncharacterized protein n=1 Tax=Arundo donax TaxID=35708 RepID=A0A0A9HTQ8_ARUDO
MRVEDSKTSLPSNPAGTKKKLQSLNAVCSRISVLLGVHKKPIQASRRLIYCSYKVQTCAYQTK